MELKANLEVLEVHHLSPESLDAVKAELVTLVDDWNHQVLDSEDLVMNPASHWRNYRLLD